MVIRSEQGSNLHVTFQPPNGLANRPLSHLSITPLKFPPEFKDIIGLLVKKVNVTCQVRTGYHSIHSRAAHQIALRHHDLIIRITGLEPVSHEDIDF